MLDLFTVSLHLNADCNFLILLFKLLSLSSSLLLLLLLLLLSFNDGSKNIFTIKRHKTV